MIFNGIEKPYLTVLRGRKRPAWAPVERELAETTAMAGAHLSRTKRQVRIITVPVLLESESFSDLQKVKEDLAEWLVHDEAKELMFKDELDRIYFAVVDGGLDLDELVRWGEGEITFLCPDPHKYSNKETETEIQDTTMVHNEGTEPVAPIIELTAHKKATFVMVNNMNDEYNLLGYPLEEEGHEEVIEQKPVVFYEDGTSIDQWSYEGAKVDDYFNDITGTMTSDGSGIRAGNYGGAGDRIHGPAMITTLPTALTDFEVKTNFDIISRRVEDNFRIEVYLFDEAMNNLGKIGIKDNSRTQNRRVALGRVGEYRGSGKKNGYAIGESNYTQDKLGETTLMHMSVKREGNLYTFYVGRYRNGINRTTLTETYLDAREEYNGKLRYIGLFIGNYKDRAVPNRLRMNSLEVMEIRQLTVDQTPYVIEEGDEIIIDHADESVYINGVDYMPLRVFGSDFFKLHEGYNQLEINPPDTFSGVIKHREKYK